jgi:hypothetical protein
VVLAHSSALRKRCLTLQSITSTALRTKLKNTIPFKTQVGTLAPKAFGASFPLIAVALLVFARATRSGGPTSLILDIVSVCHRIVP